MAHTDTWRTSEFLTTWFIVLAAFNTAAAGELHRPKADFDANGYADLAIGVPEDTIDSVYGVGSIQAIYGSENLLTIVGNRIWDQDDLFGGENAFNARFGHSLAAGDFDGNGFVDLAAGAPGTAVSGNDGAGAVHVLYGYDPSGLSRGSQIWDQDTGSVEGAAEIDDAFGSSLASGDFDGDGYDDLAVGSPGQTTTLIAGVGKVSVLPGTPDGLSGDNQHWVRGYGGLGGTPGEQDRFGENLHAIPRSRTKVIFFDGFERGNTTRWH